MLFLLPKRKSPAHMSKKLSGFCLHSTFWSNFKAIDIDSIAKVDYTLKPQIIASQILQEDSSSFFHVFQLSLFCTQSGLEFDPYFQRIHYIKLLYALFAQSRQAQKKNYQKPFSTFFHEKFSIHPRIALFISNMECTLSCDLYTFIVLSAFLSKRKLIMLLSSYLSTSTMENGIFPHKVVQKRQ